MEINSQKSENKLFFSYISYPKIKFETYEPDEKILLLLRAHPFTQLGWIFNVLAFIIIILFSTQIIFSFLKPNQIFIFYLFSLVFLFSFSWINILNWYFNVGIITNKRVIDIDFHSILYREITVARLDKIEDITIKSGGYFQAFFNYGTIFFQTAGKENNIEFADIPYPSLVVEQISKLLGKKDGN